MKTQSVKRAVKKLRNVSIVHKFGGSSLKSAKRFQAVKKLLNGEQKLIVLSAIGNTTRLLRQGLHEAAAKKDFLTTLETLKSRHSDMAKELLSDASSYLNCLQNDISHLSTIYQAISIMGHYSELTEDFVLSYGELWSSKLTAQFLGEDFLFVDAFDLLVVNKHHGHCDVDWKKTEKKALDYLKNKTFKHLVVTGYTACNQENQRITLGFNGSDYSAAILAKLFMAPELVIWTDVDGLFSADPRLVPSAKIVPKISYYEAKELAYFGAAVVHPQAMLPAMKADIPITIKNSYNLKSTGTMISLDGDASNQVKGLSVSEPMCLLTVRGLGLSTAAHMANKLFEALHLAHIRVYAASQASSEHSLSVVIAAKHRDAANKICHRCFDYELLTKQIEKIDFLEQVSILAVVGDALQNTPSLFEKFLQTLQEAHIDIRLIAHSYGARNIAVVIDELKAQEALVVVHQAVFEC